eukprot:13162465-Alexandrium_andersonii.AAC.1
MLFAFVVSENCPISVHRHGEEGEVEMGLAGVLIASASSMVASGKCCLSGVRCVPCLQSPPEPVGNPSNTFGAFPCHLFNTR